MQAVEHLGEKSILVSDETFRRIAALRHDTQTYGDVIEESIRMLEMERQRVEIPCIDDISDEELDRRFQEMKEHPEECFSLDDILRERSEMKGVKHV